MKQHLTNARSLPVLEELESRQLLSGNSILHSLPLVAQGLGPMANKHAMSELPVQTVSIGVFSSLSVQVDLRGSEQAATNNLLSLDHGEKTGLLAHLQTAIGSDPATVDNLPMLHSDRQVARVEVLVSIETSGGGSSSTGGQGNLPGTGSGDLPPGNTPGLPPSHSGSGSESNHSELLSSTNAGANVPAGSPLINPNSILFLKPLVYNNLETSQSQTEASTVSEVPTNGFSLVGPIATDKMLSSGGEGQDELFEPLIPAVPEQVTPAKAAVAEPVAPIQENGAGQEVAPAPEGAGLLTDFHPNNTVVQLTAALDRLFTQFGEMSQNTSHWMGGLSPVLIGMVLASTAVEIARRRQQARAGQSQDHKEMGSPWYPLGNTTA